MPSFPTTVAERYTRPRYSARPFYLILLVVLILAAVSVLFNLPPALPQTHASHLAKRQLSSTHASDKDGPLEV